MKEITALANTVAKQLNLKFDSNGVAFIEGFVERNKVQIPKEDWGGLI